MFRRLSNASDRWSVNQRKRIRERRKENETSSDNVRPCRPPLAVDTLYLAYLDTNFVGLLMSLLEDEIDHLSDLIGCCHFALLVVICLQERLGTVRATERWRCWRASKHAVRNLNNYSTSMLIYLYTWSSTII